MGVYKKRNRWYIDYYVEGRRRRECIGPSRKLAETVLKKRQVEIAEGKFLDVKAKPRVTFEQIRDKYLEWAKANKRSWDRDELSLRHLATAFSGKLLSEITPWLIEKYKVTRKQEITCRHEEVKPRTVNIEVKCLKRMFNMAIQWGLAETNPVNKVRMLKEAPGRLRYLSAEEIQKLLEVSAPHLKAIVLTALESGMRKGELLDLMWDNIDLEHGLILLKQTKTGERREIPMTDTLKELFIGLRKQTDGKFVFLSSRGKPLGNIRQAFETACRKVDIEDFRFHDLRHTFASHLVMSGADIRTVQEVLGHKTLQMTERYSHLSPAHKRDALNKLDRQMRLGYGHQMDTSTPQKGSGRAVQAPQVLEFVELGV